MDKKDIDDLIQALYQCFLTEADTPIVEMLRDGLVAITTALNELEGISRALHRIADVIESK